MKNHLLITILVSLGLLVQPSSGYASVDDGVIAAKKGDFKTALKVWLQLAKQGDANAQTNLARLYRDGLGVAQDYQEAAKWYRKAADQGHAGAQANLGAF